MANRRDPFALTAGVLISFIMGGAIGGVIESRYREMRHCHFKPVYGFGACLAFAVKPLGTLCAIPVLEMASGLMFNAKHQLWDYRHTRHNVLGHVAFPETAALAAATACISGLLHSYA